MKISAVRLLGVVTIAHALSHAILPLRGSFEPASAIRDYTPIILYIVSTTGFAVAGAGLLGFRVLSPFISPLLVLSAALSSVSIVRFGDQDLFFGVVLDAALLLIGIWRAFAGWPVSDPLEIDHFEHLGTPVSR